MVDGRAQPRQETAQCSGGATGPVLPSAFSPGHVCSEDTLQTSEGNKTRKLLPFDVLAPNTAYRRQFCFSLRVVMPRGFYCNTSF